MRTLAVICILLFHCGSSRTHASSIEATFGGSARYIEGESVLHGNSLRMRYKFFGQNTQHGFFVQSDLRSNVYASDYGVAYGFQSSGNTYFEGGAGAKYSPVWGPGAMVLLGLGVRVSQRFFVSLPLIYRTGGLDGIQFTPYFGIVF